MKASYISGLIMLLFIDCSKENRSTVPVFTPGNTDSTAHTATIPLNDLREQTFMGYTGGLYPAGLNNPSGQYATDLLAISKKIIPIDTFGNPATNGKVVFISLGASVGGHMMRALKLKTTNNPATNPGLLLLNCNQGSGFASLNSIMNPYDSYWVHVNQIITGNTSYRQVQVLYLETDDSTRVTWPSKPNIVRNNIASCLRLFKQKFPNVKLVYVLGRTRTFDNVKTLWNKEPGPYYFGWGCKWAIADQINGVPGTQYKGNNAVAPMITWGFYEWADSLPRKTDGFYWRYSQTVDGLHATTEGQQVLTTRFQDFLLADPYASIWYAKH